MVVKLIIFLFLFSFGACSVIIPEELPSLLSVAYSNIPPIKKGTDSRVGFGFAFGNHADFQIMFELGPQTNTMNLNGQPFPTNTKRQVPSLPPQKINKNREKFYQTEAGKYLQSWAQKMNSPPKQVQMRPEVSKPGEVMNLEDSVVELVQNEKGEYEIHQPRPGHMPQLVLDNLKKLYGEKKDDTQKQNAQETGEQKRSEEEVRKITEDLSNVDLD